VARGGTTSARGDPEPRVPAHPLLLDTDLAGWAGTGVARGGRRDALLGRVETLRMSLDGRTLDGSVRGNRPLPYRVEVRVADRGLDASCTCSTEPGPPCRHAVAVVEALRFPTPRRRPTGRARAGRPGQGRGRIVRHARAAPGFVLLGGAEPTRPREERLAQAREEEVAQRRLRARRRRHRVRERPPDEGPPRYDVGPHDAVAPETVTLRGAELAACTCADFASNEIGTCEHVERVRTARARQRKGDRATVPGRLVSLWRLPRAWSEEAPDPLREVRIDVPAGTAPPDPFGADGWLVPPPAGVARASWLRGAAHAARAWSLAGGRVWDLDPAVDEVASEVEAADALRARLDGGGAGADAWSDVRRSLRLSLHPYQEEGSLFLARRGRAFLADDMGLGKTVQAIAAALLLRRTAGAERALVVCPASLKHQWQHEIAKCCGEEATVVEHGPEARRMAWGSWKRGFLVVNYELVLRDLADIRATNPDLVILDEAQRIKNWSTATARAVKRLDSPFAFVLTGTPLENRLHELHSLVEFLHPRALGPRWRLLPFHAVTDARGRVVAYEGLDVLRRRLDGFFLRRERRAVLDQLPERTDNTYWTGMTATQRRPYRRHAATAAALSSARRPLESKQMRALLRALTSMRILCNAHAQYAWDRHAARLADPRPPDRNELRALHSPKLEEFARVLEDVLDASDRKVVVFSQWERMLRLAWFVVRELLEQRDLTAGLFYGALTGRARASLLDEFRTDPAFRVLFSTDSGGLGLNLQEASVVVNLEVPWNPAVLEQRIGRVHRLGQRRSVQVLHLVTRDAIEERVLRVVEDKRALFDGLLVDEQDVVVLDDRARSSFLERVSSLVDAP
jgi:superfamily II DNA or RNA helicase